MNSDTMNITVQVFVWAYVYSSLAFIPRSGIAGLALFHSFEEPPPSVGS